MTPDDPFRRPFPDEDYVPPSEADLRKAALQKAYEIVKDITVEKERPALPPAPKDRGPALRALNATLAVALGTWVWFAPPAWMPPVSLRADRTDEQRALGLRLTLTVEASRINAFAESNGGRLPESLAEAGGDIAHVQYRLIGPEHYQLVLADRGVSATYDSETPLAEYVRGAR